MIIRIAALSIILLVSPVGLASAKERLAGYYFPKPMSQENIRTKSRPLLKNDQGTRTAFVQDLSERLKTQSPDFVVFAAGKDARNLIIVATKGDAYDTIYRARALLESLSIVAQSFPDIKKNANASKLTFFDLCKLHGFNELTVSDGKKFAHQVKID